MGLAQRMTRVLEINERRTLGTEIVDRIVPRSRKLADLEPARTLNAHFPLTSPGGK